MGLVAKLEGKSNISFNIVQERRDGILEFYIEAHYKNGEEGSEKDLVHGPIMVGENGRPVVVPADYDPSVNYEEIIKKLAITQDGKPVEMPISLAPGLLKNLRNKLNELKKKGIEVQKVGDYTPDELEKIYATLYTHS